MDAGQALLLEVARWCPPRLVVGHDELTVGIEFESIDDPAQLEQPHVCGHADFETDVADRGRVLHVEVALDQHVAIGAELRRRRLVEVEPDVVGMCRVLVEGFGERRGQRLRRAFGGRSYEEQFERPVHDRTAGGGDTGRLGESLHRREAELHRARGERRDPRGRQRRGNGPHGCRCFGESVMSTTVETGYSRVRTTGPGHPAPVTCRTTWVAPLHRTGADCWLSVRGPCRR